LERHGRARVLGKHPKQRWQLTDDPDLPPVILRADALARLSPAEGEPGGD
jgi:hypothetical protein